MRAEPDPALEHGSASRLSQRHGGQQGIRRFANPSSYSGASPYQADTRHEQQPNPVVTLRCDRSAREYNREWY